MLSRYVVEAAKRLPKGVAVRDASGQTTYEALDRASNQVARALREFGVRLGDRVALWTEKSAKGVTVMQGSLRVGGVYVPLDPASPISRIEGIVKDCGVKVLATTRDRAEKIAPLVPNVRIICLDGETPGTLAWSKLEAFDSSPVGIDNHDPESLAYILYTSGSTGTPKGVCVSHRAATAFVDWSVAEISATSTDVFSNHAPFHFDLSVLDLYAAFSVGGTVTIIPESSAYNAKTLAAFIKSESPSVWYSVPSALVLMMDHAGLLEMTPVPIRVLCFAGEPFPVKRLRELREAWPTIRMLNLYGPTETNVCTYFEVFHSDVTGDRPVSIGKASCGDRVWAAKEDGTEVAVGETGELWVTGPTVMSGYWGKDPQGAAPYRTGDVVRQRPDGNFEYLGRRDHMVKVRGHRIELEEVEVALQSLPSVRHAAVSVEGSGLEARLVAFLVSQGKDTLGLLQVKQHCATRLPRYMIVDRVEWLAELPRTGNGKVDRHALKARLANTGSTKT